MKTTETENKGTTDVMTTEQRSRCMSRIRGKDTGPELMLRHALWHQGLRYRVNNSVTGHPDIVFKKYRVAIFVDGCFWHGCPIHATWPKSNSEFWRNKILRNIKRDYEVTKLLKKEGWNVLRYWEHEIKSDLDLVVNNIKETLNRSLHPYNQHHNIGDRMISQDMKE